MRTRHIKKLISSALGLIVLGSLWFYFAPAPLGGSSTYVVTHGISMEPRFHTGDLAIVHSQSSYHVGEIVAYENKMLHTIVLHRIIGRSGNRYLFKGDNNNFVDFEHPLGKQLVGALWLHIPGAGATLKSIRSPALVGILVAAGMLLFTGAAFTRRRRRRHRHRRVESGTQHGGPMQSPPVSAEPVAILAIGLVALLPFVMLALLAFTRPSTKLDTVPIPYKQSGTFSYSARAAPGPTYPDDHAVTGDPLFTRVVNDVNVHFGYLFASQDKNSLNGKVSLSATLTSSSGWSTTLPLGSTTYFRGDRATGVATLDLTSLQALIHSVENTTRVGGSYKLTITPHVSATGNLDQLPLSATFSPQLTFSLTELEAQPILGDGASSVTTTKSSPSVFAPSSSGSVPSRRYQPLSVSLLFARPTVATTRSIALIGIAIVICALIAILALLRPRMRPRDEATSIHARYGHMIVPISHVAQPLGTSVIDVADMEALVRIAEHYDRSILHETAAGAEAFWVTDESGQFRYAVGTPTPVTAEHVLVPQPAVLTSDVYADELELGGAISAFAGQTAPEPVVPQPVTHGWVAPEPAIAHGWASPEPTPTVDWTAADTATHERWMARDLADALTQDNLSWPSADEDADVSPTRAGAFARLAGLH
jgi:signal peptidase I